MSLRHCAGSSPLLATHSLRDALSLCEQSVATPSAAQTSDIRASLNRPSRSTRTPSDTLSTESRFTTDSRGTGSAPGSSGTSLGSLRIVVVQGATSARLSLGIAASRERTTTGRRPTSGSSHHQTSPRAGSGVTTSPRLNGTNRGRPIRRSGSAGDRHTPSRPHRSRPPCVERATIQAPRRGARNH